MRKTILALFLGFLLACAGAIDAMTPTMPFPLPEGAEMTNLSMNSNNGVNTTTVSYATPDVDPVDVHGDIHEALLAEGWTVNASVVSGDTAQYSLVAEKDSEKLDIVVTDAEGGGAAFVVTRSN